MDLLIQGGNIKLSSITQAFIEKPLNQELYLTQDTKTVS